MVASLIVCWGLICVQTDARAHAAAQFDCHGDKLVAQRRYHEAIKPYSKAIDLAPTPQRYSNRMRAYYRLGKWEDYARDFDTLCHLPVQDVHTLEAIDFKAQQFLDAGKLEQAVDWYQRSIELASRLGQQSSNVFRLRTMALLNIQRSRFGEAIENGTQLVELSKQKHAHYGDLDLLARMLVTVPDSQLRNGARAVSLAEKACRISEWTDTVVIETLAAAYAERGDWPQAIATQERALDLVRKERDRVERSSGKQDSEAWFFEHYGFAEMYRLREREILEHLSGYYLRQPLRLGSGGNSCFIEQTYLLRWPFDTNGPRMF